METKQIDYSRRLNDHSDRISKLENIIYNEREKRIDSLSIQEVLFLMGAILLAIPAAGTAGVIIANVIFTDPNFNTILMMRIDLGLWALVGIMILLYRGAESARLNIIKIR